MSVRRHLFATWSVLATLAPATALVTTTALVAAPAANPAAAVKDAVTATVEPIRAQRYARPDGGEYFALGLMPPKSIAAPQAAACDVVIVVDTSASQVAAHRDKALATLDKTVAKLGANDRVWLMAADLDVVKLTDGFVRVKSPQYQAAVDKLARRAPLGATDMLAVLKSAAGAFDGKATAGRVRNVLYIGDGVSAGNLTASKAMSELLDACVAARTSITSYAIGPVQDSNLLALLANQTGGMLAIDGEQNTPDKVAEYLAAALHGDVLWTADVQFPSGTRVYPQKMIPLRFDRDTIVVGSGKLASGETLALRGELAGQSVTGQWTVPAGKSETAHAYLEPLVDQVQADGGRSMSTLGATGLRYAKAAVMRESANLAEYARLAVTSGDFRNARVLVERLRRLHPQHPELPTLQQALAPQPAQPANKASASKDAATKRSSMRARSVFRLVANQEEEVPAEKSDEKPAADPPVADPPVAEAPAADPPAAAPPAAPPAVDQPGVNEPAPQGAEGDRRFLGIAEAERLRHQQRMRKEVEVQISAARRTVSANPDAVVSDMKLLLQDVERDPHLDAEVREQLRKSVVMVITEGQRVQTTIDESRAITQATIASGAERDRIAARLLAKQEQTRQLVAQFRSLMAESRYRVAEEQIGPEVNKLHRDTALATLTNEGASRIANYRESVYIMEQHNKKLNQALLQIDVSSIPFPDDEPILYPDARTWEELTNRRKKFASVDLKQRGGAEEKIFKALGEPTDLVLQGDDLKAVADKIRSRHGITVVLDAPKLEAAGRLELQFDRELQGITLRSALRLLLNEQEMGYVVKNEVLVITTQEELKASLVTKVYPVADLVLPIKDIGFTGGFGGLTGGGNTGGGGSGDLFGGGGGGGGQQGGGGF